MREITGLSFLVLIICLIVGGGILLKRCDTPPVETSSGQGPAIEVAPDSMAAAPKEKSVKSKKTAGKPSKTSTKKQKEKTAVQVRDPFSDTVPKEY